jgi:hypothetical protein
VCELLFYNFVYTGNSFNLREGGEKRKRKRDHKVCKIEQQNNRGTLRDINAATTFHIHFPQKDRNVNKEGEF